VWDAVATGGWPLFWEWFVGVDSGGVTTAWSRVFRLQSLTDWYFNYVVGMGFPFGGRTVLVAGPHVRQVTQRAQSMGMSSPWV